MADHIPNPGDKPTKDQLKVIKQFGPIQIEPYAVQSGNKTSHLGLGRDRRDGGYAVTFWARGMAEESLEPAGEDRIVDGWRVLLDDMAGSGSPIDRLIWHTQTFVEGEPLDALELEATIKEASNLTNPNPPNRDVMLRNVAQEGRTSTRQRTTFTIAIHPRNFARRRFWNKGEFPDILVKEARDFYAQVMGADSGRSPLGITSMEILGYDQLLLENLLTLDPLSCMGLQRQWTSLTSGWRGLPSEAIGWPRFGDFEPDDFTRLGRTYHAAYYFDFFPRRGMFSDSFWATLNAKVPKKVSVVIQMIPHAISQDFLETRSNTLAAGLQDKGGRRVTSAEAARIAEAKVREDTLVDEEFGFVRVYVDVTGNSPEELKKNTRKIEDVWVDANFVVVPLHGIHELGIESVTPWGRGMQAVDLGLF
ncbi:hypothetical protein HY857_01400 [Candidatus Saccharibacteria bacterium]|nr:hypothetical protein [Candidatus Saccharibacteria bacterium]